MSIATSPSARKHLNRGQRLLLACALGFPYFILGSTPLQAQSAAPANIETSSPVLPTPPESQGKVLTKQNVLEYRDQLIAPLSGLISDGKLILQVAEKLEFEWKLSRSWQQASKKNITRVQLSDTAELVSDPKDLLGSGYPFGESMDIQTEKDPQLKAHKILWNRLYAERPAGEIKYQFEFAWVGAQARLRQSTGIILKRFLSLPAEIENQNIKEIIGKDSNNEDTEHESPPVEADSQSTSPDEGLFTQELFMLQAPAVVRNYASIAWRSKLATEDRYWIYSPVIRQSRPLLASNESDFLLGSNVAFDDLFVSRVKPQGVTAQVVEEKVMLLPFASLTPYLLEQRPIMEPTQTAPTPAPNSELPPAKTKEYLALTALGEYQSGESSTASVLWNFETKRYAGSAPWLPTTALFVPRDVWIIEVQINDPYYLSGRQILVIDQESMLPFYKIIYNQAGNFERLIMGAWSLGSTKNNSLRFPFLSFLISTSDPDSPATVMRTNSAATLSNAPAELRKQYFRLLDIENHGAKAEDSAPKAGNKTAQ